MNQKNPFNPGNTSSPRRNDSAGSRRRTFAPGQDRSQYDHQLLELSRVVRVVKGGRRFRFRASVVIGNHQGKIGFGIGKSKDVQQAIQKAQGQASKSMVTVPLKDGAINVIVEGHYKSARILLKPAREGTGVIAGGTVRMVADLCGIRNLVSKTLGSSNRVNNARATIAALDKLNKASRK